MSGIIATGTPQGIRSLKDKTVRLTIDLQEIEPLKLQQLFSYIDEFVKFYITTENISDQEIEIIDSNEIEREDKPPSQRLRAVLYRLWEKDRKGYKDSELFYRFHMSQIIEHYKGKLD